MFWLGIAWGMVIVLAFCSLNHYRRNPGYGSWRKAGLVISSLFFIANIGLLFCAPYVINDMGLPFSKLMPLFIGTFTGGGVSYLVAKFIYKSVDLSEEKKTPETLTCLNCNEDVIPTKNKTNYCLHNLLALSTSLIWGIIWFFAVAKNQMTWKCPSCGHINQTNNEVEKKPTNETIKPDESPIQGLAAFKAGDYYLAFEKLQSCDTSNDPEVCFVLSELYQMDGYEWYNEKRALEFMRSSAERGQTEAIFNLGKLYLSGNGLDQNDQIGWRWLSRAALQGHTESQLWIANSYAKGWITKRNPRMAYTLALVASKKQHSEEASKLLESLERELKPEEVNQAKQKANEWQPKPPQDYRDREAQYA
ncbi:tetratricopeptide repeat protein [Pseudodesulfovibrio piezophilus]|uniref:Sel1 domain protein repeat-containing protein n=1 Tax=Pseudodesulfovibrio piezophilus (strain DSM 21447 / JCM 15486 / C1TLV30) TaxID=1322246 RepID=M1WRD6_PSEP2|nr:tetratricopeptide repeat protein [Pseudodesulfovibrio piezophilus]CCH49479.1 membrane protein of unknown function [Pseudodesulfovibrio piezophilus C1TLV30]